MSFLRNLSENFNISSKGPYSIGPIMDQLKPMNPPEVHQGLKIQLGVVKVSLGEFQSDWS